MQDTRAASAAGEDEIDLRPYLMAMLRHWKLIVGVPALAGLVAAAVSLATPATYEATVAVAIANPGAQPTPQAKAYVDLAISDRVVAQLSQELATGAPGGGGLSTADLKGKLKAATGADPSLVTLRVEDTDPDRAARIAGAWAITFARVASSTFNSSQDTLKQLDGQSKIAQERLRQAEEELANQEARESTAILQTQLTAQQKALADLYAAKASLQMLAENSTGVRERLRQRDPSAPSSSADDLAVVRIQMRVLDAPAQIQLSVAPPSSGRTVGAQLAYLESLMALLHDRSGEIDKQIAALQPLVLDLQSKLYGAQDEQTPLVARRDSARQSIRDLEAKTSQIRTVAEAGTGLPRLAGDAATVSALPRGTPRNAVVAGVLGLMVGIAMAFGLEYLGLRRAAEPAQFQHSAGQ